MKAGRIGIRFAAGHANHVFYATIPVEGRDLEEILAACRGLIGKSWGEQGTFAACSKVYAHDNPGDLGVQVVDVN